jgi:hypothetical protein
MYVSESIKNCRLVIVTVRNLKLYCFIVVLITLLLVMTCDIRMIRFVFQKYMYVYSVSASTHVCFINSYVQVYVLQTGNC